MIELLTYPFDVKLLFRKKLALKRELSAKSGLVEKRIAVLGGSTTHDVIELLELFLLGYGIKPTFYESEYAQYWEDAMFGNATLDAFAPDVIFVHTTSRNVKAWPEPAMRASEIAALLDATAGKFEAMWTKLAERKCPVIQNNFLPRLDTNDFPPMCESALDAGCDVVARGPSEGAEFLSIQTGFCRLAESDLFGGGRVVVRMPIGSATCGLLQ